MIRKKILFFQIGFYLLFLFQTNALSVVNQIYTEHAT
jgi:hypothetical protein